MLSHFSKKGKGKQGSGGDQDIATSSSLQVNSQAVVSLEGQTMALEAPIDGPYGLQILHEPANSADAVADIIFIHGLTGNRKSTWTKNPGKRNECFWPHEILPESLPTVRIATWGYDADVIRKTPMAVISTNTVEEHAEALCSDIATFQALTKSRPIIFIVHSLGGLVCKTALLYASAAETRDKSHIKSIATNTRGIIFLGTPHRGSSQASWGVMLGSMFKLFKQVNVDIVKGLEKESKQLNVLHKRFENLLEVRKEMKPESEVEVTCFFEELPMPVVGTIVPLDSATFGTHTAIGIHANHSDMTKFSGDDSNGYIRILGELSRWLERFEKERQESDTRPASGEETAKPAGIVMNGGVHHHGNNAKGANAFYGGTFGKGTQIGTIKNYGTKDDSSDSD